MSEKIETELIAVGCQVKWRGKTEKDLPRVIEELAAREGITKLEFTRRFA